MHLLNGSFEVNLVQNFQEANMANILITDLFADTDSFLTELSGTDLQVTGGGGHGHGGYGGGSKKGSRKGGKGGSRGGHGKGGSRKGSRKGGSKGGHGHHCW
jgi:hypothetical protein